MFNITGHLCLMSFDVLLICVFNDGVFDAVIVLTVFLIEIWLMLGQELFIAFIVQ